MLSSPALPFLLLAPPPTVHVSPSRTNVVVATDVPGAQPVDVLYILGVGSVAAFAVRSVFDSAFPENTNEYVPPTTGTLRGPLDALLGGDAANADPAEQAEKLRQQLLAAAEAGDLKTAYQKEKELKNLMAETGMRLIVDDEYQQSEDAESLPERW